MSEPFLGEIRITAFNFPPKGWALCNGQFLPINQNQALFALFGTMYGGNGQTTFALPDLRGRTPIHFGEGYVQGERGGSSYHSLSQNEIPAHTHSLNAAAGTGDSPNPAGNLLAASRAPLYNNSQGSLVVTGLTASSAGGSQAHNNMQPYLVLNFIVALQGIFPSQN